MTFLFMLLVGTAQAQNVTGAWTLTYSQTGRDGQAMERTMDITLLQDGTVVTGTVTLAAMGGRGGGGGGGGGAPREIEIQDGTMEGNVLTFSLTMGMGERSMTQSFTATVTGNTMEGTMTGGMRQTGDVPFTGVKKEG
jgi:hypothetical protein